MALEPTFGPAPGAPQRADVARNRARLLAAADRVAREQREVTVVAVAREAGLTRATTYRHFPDRESMLLAAVAEQAEAVLVPLLTEIADLEVRDAMRRLAEALVEAVAGRRHLILAMGDDLEATVRRVVPDEPMAADLARRRAAGEQLGEESDLWLARAVRALCLAAVQVLAEGREHDDVVRDQLTRSLVRLVG